MQGGRRIISIEARLLMVIWVLGNQESFRGVGDRFDLSPGILSRKRSLYFSNLFNLF